MMPTWLLGFLVCPVCRQQLRLAPDAHPEDGVLKHDDNLPCRERYPLIGGIPRLLRGSGRAALVATKSAWFGARTERRELARLWSNARPINNDVVSDFDYEWSRYGSAGTGEQRRMFDLYFDLVPSIEFTRDAVVLDAGCGAGRWASQVADRGPRVIALDLGLSVEVAQRNLGGRDIGFVQADLVDTPLAPESIDWAYSLGVLHHVNDPSGALSAITRTLKPNGALLLYLYYALDNRGKAFRSLFSLVNAVRRITSRLPRPAAHAFALIVAASIYLPLARLSLVLDQFGAHRAAAALPLSMYRERSFRTMRNDSLDRFGTRLEKRFSRHEVIDLMNRAGLSDIRVSADAPYWHAIGQRRLEQE